MNHCKKNKRILFFLTLFVSGNFFASSSSSEKIKRTDSFVSDSLVATQAVSTVSTQPGRIGSSSANSLVNKEPETQKANVFTVADTNNCKVVGLTCDEDKSSPLLQQTTSAAAAASALPESTERKRTVSFTPPLLSAIMNQDLNAVRLLVSTKGIDFNIADNSGSTPLQIAVNHGNLEIVRSLLASGANPNTVNIFGFTPLTTAKTMKNKNPDKENIYQKIIELLEQKIASNNNTASAAAASSSSSASAAQGAV